MSVFITMLRILNHVFIFLSAGFLPTESSSQDCIMNMKAFMVTQFKKAKKHQALGLNDEMS